MKSKILQVDSISKDHFLENWNTKRVETIKEYKSIVKFFKPYIDVIPKTALGEYYWQIFNNGKPFPKILRVGGAVEKLTPTTAEGLLNMPFEEFITFYHPDDLQQTFAFVIKIFEILFDLDPKNRNNFNFNIITRVRNSEQNYEWNSLQYPALYFDSDGNFLYGMVLYTNINHLVKDNAEPMLTILDSTDKQNHVFTCFTQQNQKGSQIAYPTLTKRQKEIVALLGQGKASKQIADILGIHKTTVDNHRQRMLKKFNVSSSSELVTKLLIPN